MAVPVNEEMSPRRPCHVFLVLGLLASLGGSVSRGEGAPRIAGPRAPSQSATPLGAGLKGLQVQMIDDALSLGIKHAALNVSLTSLIDLDARPDSFRWQSGGRTFYFSHAAVEGIPVVPLSSAGVRVYLILLSTLTSDARLSRIVRPAAVREVPNGITGFNVSDPEGRRYFEACIEFLADRFSSPDGRFGRVVGYIVGNEVNSHGEWYCIGPAKSSQVAADYLSAVRIAQGRPPVVGRCAGLYFARAPLDGPQQSRPAQSVPRSRVARRVESPVEVAGRF